MEAGRYVHGVAVHWYLDSLVPPSLSLGATHHLFPEYYLFATEACAGWNPLQRGVMLGSWRRAEQYAHDIIQVGLAPPTEPLRACLLFRYLIINIFFIEKRSSFY